jgi:hypothetical protein
MDVPVGGCVYSAGVIRTSQLSPPNGTPYILRFISP